MVTCFLGLQRRLQGRVPGWKQAVKGSAPWQSCLSPNERQLVNAEEIRGKRHVFSLPLSFPSFFVLTKKIRHINLQITVWENDGCCSCCNRSMKEDREDAQERAWVPRGRVRGIFTKGSDGGGIQAGQTWEGNPSRGCSRSKDTES